MTPSQISALAAQDGLDAEWYRAQYPDVDLLQMDPTEHYVRYGRRLGRPCKPAAVPRQAEAPRGPMPAAGPDVPADAGAQAPDIRDFARQEWNAYERRGQVLEMLTRKNLPLVSVVMTSHNAEDTVEAAVESMLMQSYPNLEVIVCDDASTDRTWSILQSMERRTGGSVRAIRLARNSGTYLAKNVAIAAAEGEFILFQDSDDYSHTHRVACSVEPLLEDDSLIGTRTKYARFNPETFRVIAREGHNAKLGLITLCVRRQAFEEIGYFDAVRKAGDDEWFRRLKHLFGNKRVRDLNVCLYNAELRRNSLIADMVVFNSDGSIDQNSSDPRRNYVAIFSERFQEKSYRRTWYRDNFPIFPSKALYPYPEEIAALKNERPIVVAAVCSIPGRVTVFQQVVDRILPQVDELHVYLDKYESVPMFLMSPKISVKRSQEYEVDFRDNAKFLCFDAMKRKYPGGFYYFTLDDDIIYPFDYVRHMIACIEDLDRSAIVGVHGVLLAETPNRYSDQRAVYHFSADNVFDPKPVNNLGTGTVAFWSETFPSIDPHGWGRGGMVDIDFSIMARENRVPMVSIPRHAGWLKPGDLSKDDAPLYKENKQKEDIICAKLRPLSPWGYEGIKTTLEHLGPTTRSKVEAIFPRFDAELAVKSFYHRMRPDSRTRRI